MVLAKKSSQAVFYFEKVVVGDSVLKAPDYSALDVLTIRNTINSMILILLDTALRSCDKSHPGESGAL